MLNHNSNNVLNRNGVLVSVGKRRTRVFIVAMENIVIDEYTMTLKNFVDAKDASGNLIKHHSFRYDQLESLQFFQGCF